MNPSAMVMKTSLLCVLSVTFFVSQLHAISVTADEREDANTWAAEHISANAEPPFSFTFDGKPSSRLLASWPKKFQEQQLDSRRTQQTLIWTDPQSHLQVQCVAVAYSDFPVVEWTVYIKNTGEHNTPILENLQGLDLQLTRGKGPEFLLHYARGDFDIPESYEPLEQVLFRNTIQTFAPVGGRPTNSAYPYYNVQMGDRGMILALGWPGEWAITFDRSGDAGLHITAGQQLTHLYLRPGEEIRSPLIAMLFWRGKDFIGAQNLWRRWMLADNLPRIDGRPPGALYTYCNGAFYPGLQIDERSQEEAADELMRQRIRVDYWWIDAGWYPSRGDWKNTGTWKPDPERFPHGIKAVSDYVHAHGMKLIVWFEPERVTPGSWIAENHPEWVLGGKLLNLGDPTVRTKLTDYIDHFIHEQGIDVYRQDFNMDPLAFWRNNDSPDRQGVTENLYVQGYLAYWDELRRRNPKLWIDTCASGGRRDDLETLRRAVPLIRSDYQAWDSNPDYAKGNQGATYGLSFWLPYYGQGVYMDHRDPVYYVRSHMCPAFAIAVDTRKADVDWAEYRRLVAEWRKIADRMLGDYYPLTPYSLEKDQWIAWQFDRPEKGDGMIQAFRRVDSPLTSMRIELHGLEPAARYKLTDFDRGLVGDFTGRELMESGIVLSLRQTPSSAILTYERIHQ